MKKVISGIIAVIFALCFLTADTSAELYVSAVSAILINADTGAVIYEKNAYEQRAIASTTKIMTALLTILEGELDKEFTVDSYAIRVEGTSMGLREGDIVTRRALVYGMLLPSGNDAANAAAVNISGSMAEFAEKMNLFAKSVGMNDTHFVTPSGLDADGHYSTAYDMALLTRIALKNDVFAEICTLDSATVEFGNPPYQRDLYNSNKMLWSYDGCNGVKTGFTDNARRCLVSSAERDGERLICVTLNAPDDWKDHTKLLDYGFSQLEAVEPDIEQEMQIEVVGGGTAALNLSKPLTIGLCEGEKPFVTTRTSILPFVYANAKAGEVVGKACVVCNGEVLKTADIVLSADAQPQKQELGAWESFCQFLRQFLNV